MPTAVQLDLSLSCGYGTITSATTYRPYRITFTTLVVNRIQELDPETPFREAIKVLWHSKYYLWANT